MKKLLLFFVLLQLFFLSAEVYESNALAFRLSEKEALDGSGYELLVSDEEETLFLDGNEIRRKTFFPGGYTIWEGDSERVCYLDDEGRVVMEKSGGLEKRNNYSDDGLLLSSSLSDGEEILDLKTYYYDSSSNLIRIDTLDSSYLFDPSSFYFSENGEDYRIRDGYGFQEALGSDDEKINEDGSISIMESDGTLRTYSSQGLIIREEKEGEVTTYSYSEDGSLSLSDTKRGDDEEIRYYENSKLEKIEYYRSGSLSSVVDYNTDSISERRFKDGNEYAIVYYDMDGRSVRDIKIL